MKQSERHLCANTRRQPGTVKNRRHAAFPRPLMSPRQGCATNCIALHLRRMLQIIYAYMHSTYRAPINTHSEAFCWFQGAGTAGKVEGCPSVGKLGKGRAKSRKSHPSIEAFLKARHLMEEEASCTTASPRKARSPLSLPPARGVNALFTAWLGWRRSPPR